MNSSDLMSPFTFIRSTVFFSRFGGNFGVMEIILWEKSLILMRRYAPRSCLTALFSSHDSHHRSEGNSKLGLRFINVRAHTNMPPLYLNVFSDKVEWEAVSKVSDRSSDNGDLL